MGDRPERIADGDTVRTVARYAGLPLGDDRVDKQLEGVGILLELADGWTKLHLGYRFDADGSFGHMPMVARYIPAWDVPTGLNKRRVVEERDGEVVLVPAEGEAR